MKRKQAPVVVHQCKTCPWKVTTIPERDIPYYSIEKHEALRVTIRSGLDSLLGPSLHRMDCHYSMPGENALCAGWLHNQLGPGNNIGLRFAAAVGEFPVARVAGEQHESFEDTLPRWPRSQHRIDETERARLESDLIKPRLASRQSLSRSKAKGTSRSLGASRGPSGTRTHGRVRGQQAAILMVANDAALAEQYDRAIAILAQGRQRKLVTDYKTVTPESALEGEWADFGCYRESIEVTAAEIAELHEAGSHAPVTDAIVQRVVRWLRDNGCDSRSSDDGVSYRSCTKITNVLTGEERREESFLSNFTAQERRLVFDVLTCTSPTK